MLKPGDVVDRYEILEFLGKGGMGEVYRAHDGRLQRDVALKILTPEPMADAPPGATTGAARMLREARAVALLEHPNVVSVYDVGEVENPKELRGTTYLAMELIKGRALREYLANWSIPMDQRIKWLVDVAKALGAAHARGLVHRDIKPENIMIREDGVVKVLDFGIAKRTPQAEGPSSTQRVQVIPTITTQGFIVGTPHYMAPEQMRGESIDGRADQFSWGVVAYELLSNKIPWHPEEGDTLQLVAQVLSMEAEPLVLTNPDVPKPVCDVVMRALSKSKDARFATMEELALALEGRSSVSSTTQTTTTVDPPAPPRKNRPLAWAAAALFGAGVAGTVLAFRSKPNAEPKAVVAPVLARACSARACMQAHGGEPYRCREDGQCVALGSEDCKVQAERRDVENDETVWFGSLYPLTGPDAQAFGVVESQAVELARQDFAQTMGGFKKGVRPIGLLSCDDAADPARAARHLVEDVKVPAVIGFRTSAEAVNLATSTFLPSGVMTVVALNTSAQVASIPQPPGPRLVWRTTYNMSQTAVPISQMVSQVLEPRLRDGGVKGPIRVALVRPKNTGALAFSSVLLDKLAFNGKSALDNGTDYREIVYSDEASLAPIAGELESFGPHVVVYQGDDQVIKLAFEPLEAKWSAARAYRPTYLTMTVLTPEVFRFVGKDAARRKRFYGLTTVSTTPANARFVNHYNEVWKERITRTISPNSSYDSFYVLAYATYALGDKPVTGANLAESMTRLVPPGKPIEVGPTSIFDGFSALRAGQGIDLTGATGKLDFDLASGEAAVDHAILCVNVDDQKRAYDSIESGLVYTATSGKLEGALRCP